MLEEKLQASGYDVVVHNEGIYAADSATCDAFFHHSVSGGADIVLIMVGTNDISCPGNCPEPFNCHTIDNLRSMIEQAFSAGIRPVLGTVTPKNPDGEYSGFNAEIEALNNEIYTLGAHQGVQVVETYYSILNNGGAALFADKHHLNDWGYNILADQWYNLLVNIL